MSVSIREISDQFKNAKIRSGQKSTGNFKEIDRLMSFMSKRGKNFLTYNICSSFLSARKRTISDYGVQKSYQSLRQFSRWANLVDSRNEVLPKKRSRLNGRRKPNIITAVQASKIIEVIRNSASSRPFSAYTYSILVGLLFVTGMRVTEALINLSDADVNLEDNFIYVKASKAARDRYVPITPSTSRMLAEYRKNREERFPNQRDKFFLIQFGEPRCASSFRRVFARATSELGYRSKTQKGYNSRSLLPHDLRHSYATNTLLRLHSAGLNMDEQLSKLSIVLGHYSIRETYWYIEIVPDLLALVMERRFRNAR